MNDKASIEQRVKQIVYNQDVGYMKELGITSPGALAEDTTFEYLRFDSLDIIEVVMDVGLMFGIEIDWVMFRTVGDLVRAAGGETR